MCVWMDFSRVTLDCSHTASHGFMSFLKKASGETENLFCFNVISPCLEIYITTWASDYHLMMTAIPKPSSIVNNLHIRRQNVIQMQLWLFVLSLSAFLFPLLEQITSHWNVWKLRKYNKIVPRCINGVNICLCVMHLSNMLHILIAQRRLL